MNTTPLWFFWDMACFAFTYLFFVGQTDNDQTTTTTTMMIVMTYDASLSSSREQLNFSMLKTQSVDSFSVGLLWLH